MGVGVGVVAAAAEGRGKGRRCPSHDEVGCSCRDAPTRGGGGVVKHAMMMQ